MKAFVSCDQKYPDKLIDRRTIMRFVIVYVGFYICCSFIPRHGTASVILRPLDGLKP